MGHSYLEFYYHFVWSTKRRERLISTEIEPILFAYIGKRCVEMGVFVYALNGVEDHVHLVCSVPPKIPVAELLDKIKGGSSHYMNHLENSSHVLYWQAGYGGLTFGKKDLKRIVAYVQNQKLRHAANNLWSSLEVSEVKENRCFR